jgi:hypothetical protein
MGGYEPAAWDQYASDSFNVAPTSFEVGSWAFDVIVSTHSGVKAVAVVGFVAPEEAVGQNIAVV